MAFYYFLKQIRFLSVETQIIQEQKKDLDERNNENAETRRKTIIEIDQ